MTPTIPELDTVQLAIRLLNQVHHRLDVLGDEITCTDCGYRWQAVSLDGKLQLNEQLEGTGACEAEVLRIVSDAGLYSEVGRRRGRQRKNITRAGGRPTSKEPRCACGMYTVATAAARSHLCGGGMSSTSYTVDDTIYRTKLLCAVVHPIHGIVAEFAVQHGKAVRVEFTEDRFRRANKIRQPACDAIAAYLAAQAALVVKPEPVDPGTVPPNAPGASPAPGNP